VSSLTLGNRRELMLDASIRTDVTAAPCNELSSTRLRAFPTVIRIPAAGAPPRCVRIRLVSPRHR